MSLAKMKYCSECGHALIDKELDYEGIIPYCTNCSAFRFPVFNTACSMIVQNESKDKILLIKQYGRPDYILVAGYISQGENAETTVAREIKEELNLETTSISFNASQYYEGSNTLMVNFAVTVTGDVQDNHEIDDWAWFSIEDAKKAIKDGSLAEKFLLNYLQESNTR
ncbi:NAD(+) diphosphatase [Streptococcus henryi]|uniref:NAD(+) diphosphatase n=1 Tax=Streptococcus henryi TaxID=439219 RepID=UPI000379F2B7|nr:NUDIX domain-containing protein [Streptococcus henryi]